MAVPECCSESVSIQGGDEVVDMMNYSIAARNRLSKSTVANVVPMIRKGRGSGSTIWARVAFAMYAVVFPGHMFNSS